jgi:hypothetical protein
VGASPGAEPETKSEACRWVRNAVAPEPQAMVRLTCCIPEDKAAACREVRQRLPSWNGVSTQASALHFARDDFLVLRFGCMAAEAG